MMGSNICNHLVGSGLLEPDAAEALMGQVEKQCHPIGKVLIDTGVMTIKQVMTTLGVLAGAPHRCFGEVAIQLAFLDEPQFAEALETQAGWGPHELELPMQEQTIPPEWLMAAVVTYIRDLEQEKRDMEREATRVAHCWTALPDFASAHPS